MPDAGLIKHFLQVVKVAEPLLAEDIDEQITRHFKRYLSIDINQVDYIPREIRDRPAIVMQRSLHNRQYASLLNADINLRRSPSRVIVRPQQIQHEVLSVIPAGLNSTQKNILEGILSFPFDEIDSLPTQDDKIQVLILMIQPNLSNEDNNYLISIDMLAVVQQIKHILNHPCPQNRAENYPYFGEAPKGFVVYKDSNGRPAYEQEGLLSLTTRMDSNVAAPTKEDVCEFITTLIKEKMAAITAANQPLNSHISIASNVGFFSSSSSSSQVSENNPDDSSQNISNPIQ